MNNRLEQLEKKYIELGEEIERLKATPSKKRERSTKNKHYWFITSIYDIQKTVETGYVVDEDRFAMGNYYYSEAEALKARDRRLAEQRIFDALREHEGDWAVDWNDFDQNKYYAFYNHEDEKFCIDWWRDGQIISESCYYSSEEAWQWVMDNMEDDLNIVWWLV